MKIKYLLFLFSITTYFNVSAQKFAPYGAEWHYTVIDKQDITYHQAKSVDSIEIEGKKCRIIEVDHSCFLSDDVIIYSTANGDSVFWYEPNTAEFQLIYAFNAQPGDSWSFAVKSVYYDSLSNTDSVIFYVDSIGQRDVNGFLFPELYTTLTYTHYSTPAGGNPASLTKSIGGNYALFPFSTYGRAQSCHLPSPSQLRCYEDSYLGFYETGIVDSCTFEKTGTFTGELEGENEVVRIYPNPARREIRIAGDQSERFKEYRILSIDGRLVKSGRLSNEQVISAKQISPGLYVVVLLHDEGNITRKIVIE